MKTLTIILLALTISLKAQTPDTSRPKPCMICGDFTQRKPNLHMKKESKFVQGVKRHGKIIAGGIGAIILGSIYGKIYGKTYELTR